MQENGRSDLLEVEKEEIYCLALPRKEAVVTRRGVEMGWVCLYKTWNCEIYWNSCEGRR